jgi:hypothetical protein
MLGSDGLPAANDDGTGAARAQREADHDRSAPSAYDAVASVARAQSVNVRRGSLTTRGAPYLLRSRPDTPRVVGETEVHQLASNATILSTPEG